MTIKANLYNLREWHGGRLTAGAVTALVESYQRAAGLPVDGMAGPATLGKLFRRLGREAVTTEGERLMQAALALAVQDLGQGEVQRNNVSKWLDVVRSSDGTGLAWRGYKAPWCAAFVSYCYTRAVASTGSTLPWTSSRSSRALEYFLREYGVVHAVPQPGAVAIFRRGLLGRAGHVGIVERFERVTGTVHTIEGNASRFPSLVERRRYTRAQWRRKAIGSFGF